MRAIFPLFMALFLEISQITEVFVPNLDLFSSIAHNSEDPWMTITSFLLHFRPKITYVFLNLILLEKQVFWASWISECQFRFSFQWQRSVYSHRYNMILLPFYCTTFGKKTIIKLHHIILSCDLESIITFIYFENIY